MARLSLGAAPSRSNGHANGKATAVNSQQSTEAVDSATAAGLPAELNITLHQQLLQRWSELYRSLSLTVSQYQPTGSSAPDEYDPELLDQLIPYSRQYRQELNTFISTSYNAVQHLNDEASDDQQDDTLQAELQRNNIPQQTFLDYLLLAEASSQVFHLIEIILIDSHTNATRQLIDWYQRTEPPVLHQPTDSGDDLSSDESYWTTIYHLATQGRLHEAIELLEANIPLRSQYPKLHYKLIQLLSSVPVVSINQATSSTEDVENLIHNYRLAVQQQLNEWQSLPNSSEQQSVERLLHILHGDVSTVNSLDITSWLQLMCAHLLYVNPLLSKDEYSQLALHCILTVQQQTMDDAAEFDVESLPSIEQIYYQILSYNILPALQLIDQIIDLRWFTAHVYDLLSVCRLIPDESQLRVQSSNTIEGCTLHEYYLVQYASQLVSHPQLYDTALTYFTYGCPVNGAAYIERTIEQQVKSALTAGNEQRIQLVHNIEAMLQTPAEDVALQCKLDALHAYVRHDILQLSQQLTAARTQAQQTNVMHDDSDNESIIDESRDKLTQHLVTLLQWLLQLHNMRDKHIDSIQQYPTTQQYLGLVAQLLLTAALVQQQLPSHDLPLLCDVLEQYVSTIGSDLSVQTQQQYDLLLLYKHHVILLQQMNSMEEQLSLLHSHTTNNSADEVISGDSNGMVSDYVSTVQHAASLLLSFLRLQDRQSPSNKQQHTQYTQAALQLLLQLLDRFDTYVDDETKAVNSLLTSTQTQYVLQLVVSARLLQPLHKLTAEQTPLDVTAAQHRLVAVLHHAIKAGV